MLVYVELVYVVYNVPQPGNCPPPTDVEMPPSSSRGIVTILSRTDGQHPRREAGGMNECPIAKMLFYTQWLIWAGLTFGDGSKKILLAQ